MCAFAMRQLPWTEWGVTEKSERRRAAVAVVNIW